MKATSNTLQGSGDGYCNLKTSKKLAFEAGKIYRISFSAKATTLMYSNIYLNQSNESLKRQYFYIGEGWHDYEFFYEAVYHCL